MGPLVEPRRFSPDDADYPRQLAALKDPPVITATGPLPPVRAVAIVGARAPVGEADTFAFRLARSLAAQGITIVSGGARGIDAAAHRGALDVGGATWVVCPTGCRHVAPKENQDLFDEISSCESGRLVWPFPDDTDADRASYLTRNGVLVALAEAVVVIQARLQSGSRNAASWAAKLGRPLWMPAAPPWGAWSQRFGGSLQSIESGQARVLTSTAQLFRSLGLDVPKEKRGQSPPSIPLARGPERGPDATWSPDELAVFSATSLSPKHQDEVAVTAGLPITSTVTALLTLSLKDVVVEGPNGFFRRKYGG